MCDSGDNFSYERKLLLRLLVIYTFAISKYRYFNYISLRNTINVSLQDISQILTKFNVTDRPSFNMFLMNRT